MSDVVLVINPGSTSTKLALFDRKERLEEQTLRHTREELAPFPTVADQYGYRGEAVARMAQEWLADGERKLVAVVGRGGLLAPCPGGIYPVTDAMVADLQAAHHGEHASNLGAPLARGLADRHGVPSYIADPVVTDELIPEARLSGLPDIERKSRAHALNIKACARQAAAELGKPFEKTNFVVAHAGGGFSVVALRHGALIDANDALLGMGPFSPERCGALPIGPLVELAFSGRYTQKELLQLLAKRGGVFAYLGTNDMREVRVRIDAGDEEAALVYGAMLHQLTKEAGAMSAVLRGQLDGVILTGGLCLTEQFARDLSERVAHLGRVFVYPGENELIALAAAGFRAIDDAEELREYQPQT